MLQVTNDLREVFSANPLYSKDGKGQDAEVIAKFFLPCSEATWLITEAEEQSNGDWLLFGFCKISDWEFGYVSFRELQSIRVCGIFEIEEDSHFTRGTTIKQALIDLGATEAIWKEDEE